MKYRKFYILILNILTAVTLSVTAYFYSEKMNDTKDSILISLIGLSLALFFAKITEILEEK